VSRKMAEPLQKALLCKTMARSHSAVSWEQMSVLSNYTFLLTVLAAFKEYGCVTSLKSLSNQSSSQRSAGFNWTTGTQVLHVLALSCSLWHCISGFL